MKGDSTRGNLGLLIVKPGGSASTYRTPDLERLARDYCKGRGLCVAWWVELKERAPGVEGFALGLMVEYQVAGRAVVDRIGI